MSTLELREEELFAEKRLVQLGMVRIRRRVITETRNIEVVVTREAVTIERFPMQDSGDSDQWEPATRQLGPELAEQLRALQLGETLRLPIVEEQVIVQKRPMVTQEVIIDKRLVEEVRKLSGTVCREDGHVAQTFDSLLPDRVRSGVLSEQQSMVVRVEHEETSVEQVPVEPRPAERQPGAGAEVVDIPEYGEQVTLHKRPLVKRPIKIAREALRSTALEVVAGEASQADWNGRSGWTL